MALKKQITIDSNSYPDACIRVVSVSVSKNHVTCKSRDL